MLSILKVSPLILNSPSLNNPESTRRTLKALFVPALIGPSDSNPFAVIFNSAISLKFEVPLIDTIFIVSSRDFIKKFPSSSSDASRLASSILFILSIRLCIVSLFSMSIEYSVSSLSFIFNIKVPALKSSS